MEHLTIISLERDMGSWQQGDALCPLMGPLLCTEELHLYCRRVFTHDADVHQEPRGEVEEVQQYLQTTLHSCS